MRTENIVHTVLREAHERRVEQAMKSLQGPEGSNGYRC
jgi:hypothetical protein